jgi:CheY-like chemotaxis protein
MGGNEMKLRGMKVLIVDDIQENIDNLIITLESEGYDITTATSGEKALQLANDFLPDLVLLDVEMGGIDGFETCRRLKQNEFTNDIPVIFVTASVDLKDVDQGFLCGGVDYISKPFRHEEVCARVRTHLHLRALVKQQQSLIIELQDALEKVKTLSGLLPICAWCKMIRDDSGYWNQIEIYIRDHSEADFTHSICPECRSQVAAKS